MSKLLEGKVVIKHGTDPLTVKDPKGKIRGIDNSRIEDIAHGAYLMFNNGVQPIHVSSAAIVEGMMQLRYEDRPTDVRELQLLSSIGQPILMSKYEDALANYNISLMQMLLTHHNFQTPEERLNIRMLAELGLSRGHYIVANTNDVVTNEEIEPLLAGYKFYDNDPLAAILAVETKANSLILVSENGNLGKGGGESKDEAIRMANEAGIKVAVMSHPEYVSLIKEELRV